MPLPYHVDTGHNCPLEAQVRITGHMNEDRGLIFGLSHSILKWAEMRSARKRDLNLVWSGGHYEQTL